MAPRATLPLVALLVLLPGGNAGVEPEGEIEDVACNLTQFSTQLDGVLSTYDREWAPEAPVLVRLALAVRHATVCETAGTVHLLADLHMSWVDQRLQWNASDSECHTALASAERLWRPDVGVLSAASASEVGDGGLRARLSAIGSVSWVQRLDLKAPVSLDLTAWPRDTHRIIFKFGSRSHFVDEVDLVLEDIEATMVFETGSWEMLAVESTKSELKVAGGSTRVAMYAVTLRRRAAAHALAATAVLVGAALLLLAAMLLPPHTRAPLCAAASFTAALWLSSGVARIGNSSGAPHVLCALGALCAYGGAGAAAAALAVRVTRCSRPAPATLRRLRAHPALRWFTTLEVQGGEESGAWVAAGQLLDSLSILALLIAVLLTVLLAIVLD